MPLSRSIHSTHPLRRERQTPGVDPKMLVSSDLGAQYPWSSHARVTGQREAIQAVSRETCCRDYPDRSPELCVAEGLDRSVEAGRFGWVAHVCRDDDGEAGGDKHRAFGDMTADT